LSYEAGAGLDNALQMRPPSTEFPLIWFALYDVVGALALLPRGDIEYELDGWHPSAALKDYCGSIQSIQEAIRCGETYQVNYTIRLRSNFRGDPFPLFCSLYETQPTPYAAYLNLGRFHVCSLSPELFFSRNNDLLMCKPMKGTAPRGSSPSDDALAAERLRASPKNRAENIMIVDMIRNDLGRIAVPGTVRVDELFAVERHPTLLQMTSTVRAETRASLAELFQALFPCASVTGAPKIATTQIIRRLEGEPRGIYTGCIGYIAPGGNSRFSVAIRTALIDMDRQSAEYGTGSGIVADSNAEEEYAECQLKAAILRIR
jgi:para-aminobenzoate synthetase/4-amino-4-deoxychorismate lyase